MTAEVNRRLHRSFFPSIDRVRIHGLIDALHDILNFLQDASETCICTTCAKCRTVCCVFAS